MSRAAQTAGNAGLQTGTAAHDLVTRGRRARSWYERGAAIHEADKDLAFILYWIAFNAAYGKDLPQWRSTAGQFQDYFRKLTLLDNKKAIESALWDELFVSVDTALNNRYLYASYWRHLNGESASADWREDLQECNTRVERARKEGDNGTVLRDVFRRLDTLRNQLLHGGATWKSERNRDLVEHGARIMQSLVPMFIKLMLDNPQEDWGPPWHPPGLEGEPRVRPTP